MTNPKFYETQKFKKLDKKWKEKLSKEGFDDIEMENGGLKEWATTRALAEKNSVIREAKEIYYRLAGQFLHSHSFNTQEEYDIWKLHSEGVSYDNIEKQLNLGVRRSYRIIKKLRDIMRIKVLPNQVSVEDE